jgi:Ca2+-binding EF-hand superfamily protein
MNGMSKKPITWLGALVIAVAMLGGVSLAHAKEITPRQAFENADTDNDGNVDVEEFRRRKIEIFVIMDANGDGFIVVAEVPEDHKSKFDKVDENRDGRATLNEYLVYVMPAYWTEHDTNKDNVLTIDEVEAAAKKK